MGSSSVRSTRASAWGRRAARGAVVVLFVGPLVAALPLALREALTPSAWQALWADPTWARMTGLSLFSALVSTIAALALTMAIVAWAEGRPAWRRLAAWLSPLLAVPHAAFGIGLAWLVSPTGEIARLCALALGWSTPPDWATVHDAQALMLTLTLFLKEWPFLLWNAVALLSRPEVAQTLDRQRALARTMGITPTALWWRVLWPQWLPRLAWPILAVLAYALTVVDLGLVIGPTSPPTLAVSAYADLIDGDPARNRRGAAAALWLGVVLALLTVGAWRAWPALQRRWIRRGVQAGHARRGPGSDQAVHWVVGTLLALYAIVIATLALLSVAGLWTFPALWPQSLGLSAWARVAQAADTIVFTTLLAAAASVLAMVLTVAWLEATPPRWDAAVLPVVLAPLVVPALLLMAGLYQGALHLRLDGTRLGLLWVHLLVVLPYSFITLHPAWRAFDPRLQQTAMTLGRRPWAFWWHVKWPLLAAPLASTLAVGFAVSVAQYLATQFIGAGRHPTITTEAVTLASGGQRSLAAAFALLQALWPGLAFGAAAWIGSRRDA